MQVNVSSKYTLQMLKCFLERCLVVHTNVQHCVAMFSTLSLVKQQRFNSEPVFIFNMQ
jgi:hypothetical protein